MPDIVITFFALGLVAGLIKSDLKVPAAVYETLSILLMLTLGLKGGLALHESGASWAMLPSLLAILSLGLLIPAGLLPMLQKLVKLNRSDAISVAAHYGSVSAGTFAVALALVQASNMPLAPETTLYLVMLEIPALMLMLWWYQRGLPAGSKVLAHNPWHEALSNRSVLLLMGGVVIGWMYGAQGMGSLHGVLMGGFETFLALFLLEMGICTARVCRPLPLQHWRLLLFAAVAPFALAWVGLGTGVLLGLPAGSVLILAALTASASYIAAPAAVHAAIPSANTGLAMLAALGITFPVNVLIGLPLYQQWVWWLVGCD